MREGNENILEMEGTPVLTLEPFMEETKKEVKKGKEDFVTEDILDFLKQNPDIESVNKKFFRNEGLAKSLANDELIESENAR